MKSRVRALLDKSIGAMISAIEVYNKPSFRYREETFSVLAINAWELLLKAKWLKEHGNNVKSLYVMEYKSKKDGQPSRVATPRLTASGNPFTVPIRYLVIKLEEHKFLTPAARANLDILIDIRDSSVHFYNKNLQFAKTMQEVGCAAVKNFVFACEEWFDETLADFNFFLMPIAFLTPEGAKAVPLNQSEANVAEYIAYLDTNIENDDYSVAVTMSVKFERSSDVVDGMKVRISNDSDAVPVQFSDELMKARFPLVYETLTAECRKRYSDFKATQKYHDIRDTLKSDPKYCHTRLLDPNKPSTSRQDWYSHAVFTVLDGHYTKKKSAKEA